MGQLEQVNTTKWLLINWGRWAYHNRGLNLYFPSIEPHELMRGSIIPEPRIPDGEALAVDILVSRLRNHNYAQHEALVWHFLAGRTYKQVAKEMHTSKHCARDLVQAGLYWVDGAIHGGYD